MKYYATAGDQEYVIEIDQDDIVTVNGKRYEVDFQPSQPGNTFSLLINSRSLEAVAEEREDIWEILMRGELYEVQVQDERAYRLAQARSSVAETTGDQTIVAPMPGIIVAVTVSEGEWVESGQQIVILESMKMENELRALQGGVVGRIFVEVGTSVEKDQALVTIIDPEG
jgi:biotin carboxyl carrier protein